MYGQATSAITMEKQFHLYFGIMYCPIFNCHKCIKVTLHGHCTLDILSSFDKSGP